MSIAKITNLGRAAKGAIECLFKGRFSEGSVVCTDAHKASADIAEAFGVEHIAIDSKNADKEQAPALHDERLIFSLGPIGFP